jgi:O-antigen/teichoic acid export membrane protein
MNSPSYRHGILVTTGSSFLGRALAVISGIILAKTLVPDLLGRFFSDQALVLIGGGVINLGIGQGYRQIVSREPELRNSYLLGAIFIRSLAMLLYFSGLMVYLGYTGRFHVQTLVVSTAVLLLCLLEIFQIDLQVFRRYSRAAVLICGKGVFLFSAVIACRMSDANYDLLVYSYLALISVLLILGWFLVRPHITSVIKFDYGGLIKVSIPFAASLFAYSFMGFWGLTYIREVLGEQQAGYYCVPLKLYQMALIFGMSVSGVTIPLYHKLAASKNFETYSAVFGRLVRGVWFIGGPIVAMCCFIPEYLIRIVANEQYLAAAPIFPWIGFGIMFRMLAIPAGNICESIDKQWYRVVIQFIGAIICAFAVTFIVPKWGIVGAGWTLFSVDLWIVSAYWTLTRCLVPSVVSLRKLLVPGAVLATTLLCLHLFEISAWLKLVIFCALWLGYVLVFLNAKEEVHGFLTVIAKRGK